MLYLVILVILVAIAAWWLASDTRIIWQADKAMNRLERCGEEILDEILRQMEDIEMRLNEIACRGWRRQVQKDAEAHLRNINELRLAQAVEYHLHAGLP